VTVFSAPREFFTHYLASADPALEDTVHPDVRVERPPMNFYRWKRDLREFGPLRGNLPVLANAAYNAAQDKVFPEHYLTWVPGVLRRALRLHARRRFDLVVATGNPFASFAAAWALGRTLKIPYVVDYRDAWTFNQFTEELRFPPGSKAWTWEERVLRDAAEAVFVNEGMLRWHAERYPFAADRMTVVPNGWEPEILGDLGYTAPEPGRPLRFGYLGTVTAYLPLEELFAGWRLAREHPLLADAELHLHGHLGFFPHEAAQIRARIPEGPKEGVHYRGGFSKSEVTERYAETDALVFCVPGARYVTSGKVFEYMATGKPIVSVHRPDIAASEVLDGYPLWCTGARLDAETVAASFVEAAKLARGLTREQVTLARAHATRYTREATLDPFERRLRAMAGSEPGGEPEPEPAAPAPGSAEGTGGVPTPGGIRGADSGPDARSADGQPADGRPADGQTAHGRAADSRAADSRSAEPSGDEALTG